MPYNGPARYIGTVVYVDGLPYGTDDNGLPMEPLYREDDGGYRPAHHDDPVPAGAAPRTVTGE